MDAASIKATLKAKGQAMTLGRVTGASYDPVAGEYGTSSTQTWTVFGIVTNYGTQTKQASQNLPDSLIQSGDRLAIVDAASAVPQQGDSLTIAGVKWQVIAVDTIDPAGVALLFKLQVRR